MSEPNLVTGSYVLKSEHTLKSSPLEMAVAGMEGAAYRFSADAISDAKVRTKYMAGIRRMSDQILEDVRAGKVSVQDGYNFSYEMRNKIMFEHRKFTSAQGVAVAEAIKKKPKPLSVLLDRYSDELFQKNYNQLTSTEQTKIHYEILLKSGKDNHKFSKITKQMEAIGKVGLLLTATLATYEILNADNKVKETAKQGLMIGGGAAGGLLAGLGVSAICGPAAPACAVAVVLIGSVAGGIAGSAVTESFDEELEEFSRWDIF